MVPAVESFTDEERRALEPYFTNVDKPVFALTNLPEVVKGALFARYSRSAKSARRLFLDEFLGQVPTHAAYGSTVGIERAERLYERVFNEYGDDSVAQLGGAHIACEGVSNVLTKVLERGRLMAYLEQSTRYVPYTDRAHGGRWKYHVPKEIERHRLREEYSAALDPAFETYGHWLERLQQYFQERHARAPGDSEALYRATIRAKALDTLRGLLPAATRSNVGIYASGQAFETLLLHLRVHPLAEARQCGESMLRELRKVMAAFLVRVDRPERGGRWSHYLAQTRDDTGAVAAQVLKSEVPEAHAEPDDVALTDWDPDGELKVVAAALYPSSNLSERQLLGIARRMTTEDRIGVLRAYVGNRANRRHKPGRAFERTSYCFDILSDYGAFRDLQRHRLLTIDWQELTPYHGHVMPAAIEEVGGASEWTAVMERTAEAYEKIRSATSSLVAQYVVPLAYRIRFYMHLNAREAMHVIELRTAAQGHPAYRRICQKMLDLVAERAGHQAIAESMKFADRSEVELERLQAERQADKRRPIQQFRLFSNELTDPDTDSSGPPAHPAALPDS